MVLTLIIVTDEAAQYDAIRAANQAAREHPCRVLAVIARKPKADSRLDAEIRVGESSPGETIVLRMYGRSASTPTRWSRRCSSRTCPW
jgi:glucose-6-phosphate dehydrogenase assembly protein OpcA